MTKKGKLIESHTERTKFGMGNFYGTGYRNKFGRIRGSLTVGFRPLTKKQKTQPPRSLA